MILTNCSFHIVLRDGGAMFHVHYDKSGSGYDFRVRCEGVVINSGEHSFRLGMPSLETALFVIPIEKMNL